MVDKKLEAKIEGIANKGLSAAEADNLLKAIHALKDLNKRLIADYYTEEEAEVWMTSPQPLLNGEIPVDLIAEGRADELHSLLDAMDAGAYI